MLDLRRRQFVTLPVAALIAWLAEPLAALAQDNVFATATLPRDLRECPPVLRAGQTVVPHGPDRNLDVCEVVHEPGGVAAAAASG